MNMKSGFSLRKWYLDCVSDNGDTFIGYSGVLRWGALTLHYSSATTSCGGSQASTATSLKESAMPRMTGDKIYWSSKALKAHGEWIPSSAPIHKTLYESPEGMAVWSCHQPRSNARISLGNKEQIAGFGYAEMLELTIKPWQLPITDLRWGRFLSERDALVWVDWRGADLRSVFHNGRQCEEAEISDEQISFNNKRVRLAFTEKTILREGVLVSTALSAIPGVETILPARMLHTYECKWRSKGILFDGGVPSSAGWVIHEIVRFP